MGESSSEESSGTEAVSMDRAKLGDIGVACAVTEDSTDMLLSAVESSRTNFELVHGKDLLALEITRMSRRGQVEWSLDNSIEDLLFYLQERDLKAVKLLAEKTREVGVVAYRYAMEGRVAALAMLLLVVEDKISAPVSVVRDGVRTKRSIYNSLVDESALDGNDRRKALLCEIQLLNQFRASPWRDLNNDRRTLLPLLRAAKVGHVSVTKMLLMGDVDVNETDIEGNTALRWCLSGSSSTQESRIVWLLLKNLECCDSLTMNKKQRPIDVATSQDMRFILNTANVVPRNHSLLQKNYMVKKQNHAELLDDDFDDYDDDDFNESYTVKKTSAGHRDFRSSNFSAQGDKSKRQSAPKQGPKFSLHNHWEKHDYIRKIFVGGLPPSVDSAYVSKFFPAEFGPVEEVVVIGIKIGNRMQSRGFGFVKFQKEKDMMSAKEAHHVYVARASLPRELQRANSFRKHIQDSPRVTNSVLDSEPTKQHYFGKRRPLPEKCHPSWFFRFRKWLPRFLVESTERHGERYPLRSVKADFRSICGMELDHGALGYPKLSDFMRSLPGICRMCVVPVGNGPETQYMVLLPPRKPDLVEAAPLRKHVWSRFVDHPVERAAVTPSFVDHPVESAAVTPSSCETEMGFSFFQSQWDKYLDLRTLFIDSPVGRLSVQIRMNELCLTLRKTIEERLKTSIQNCTLRAGSQILDNNKSLHSYGLSQHSVVHLYPKLLGGQPPAKRIRREQTLFDYINDKSVQLFTTRTIPSTTAPNQTQIIDEIESNGRKLGRSLVYAFFKVSLDRRTWNGEISLQDFIVHEGRAILRKIPTTIRTSVAWKNDCGSLAKMLKTIFHTNAKHFVYLDDLIEKLENAEFSWMFQDWFRTYITTHLAFKSSLRRGHVSFDIFRMFEHLSPAEQQTFENYVDNVVAENWLNNKVQTNHIFKPIMDYHVKKYGKSYPQTSFGCFVCQRNYCTHGKQFPWDLTEYAVPLVIGNFLCDVIKELLVNGYPIEKLLKDD